MSRSVEPRRRFLRGLLAGGAGALAGCDTSLTGLVNDAPQRHPAPDPATLERRTDRYFVFYYMMGGWDITLATDPKPPGPKMHLAHQPDEVFSAGGQRFGPAMTALRPWLDRTGIIRGIKVDALNHPQARWQMVTGALRLPGEPVAASVQTILADTFGAPYALPNIASDGMRPAVFQGDRAPVVKPLRIASVDQLRALTDIEGATGAYADVVRNALVRRDALLAAKHRDSRLTDDFVTYGDLARAIGASDLATRELISGGYPIRTTDLVQRDSRWGRQAQLAVDLIRQDVAPVVSVGSGEFDSHNDNDYADHRNMVTRGFETVAAICDGLQNTPLADGGTLLDRTTIVVTSEFSREPWINELGGKHHWPTNSMVLIGNGVKPGTGGPTVFGATDDGLYPVMIDVETGATTGRGTDYLTTGNALATVLAIAGVDEAGLFDADPIMSVVA